MKLIIWLGNPGTQYRYTRHNIGFLCVDFFQQHWDFSEWKDSKFSALISEGMVAGEKILLVKPLTFMNLSGNAVQAILGFYKLTPSDIVVISDDIDMEFAKIRKRESWSHWGQNGLRDIIAKIGTSDFLRIKIGIGRHPIMSVSDWVLSKLTAEECAQLETEVFPEVAARCKSLWS